MLPPGALQCLHQPPAPSHTLPTRRTLFNLFGSRGNSEPGSKATSNPILDEYLKRKPNKSAAANIERGDLASTSIFDADRQIQEREAERDSGSPSKIPDDTRIGGQVRNPATMAAVLDPKPAVRERWQRKMVIRDIKRGGRLNKTLFTKRTERESTSQSENMKTSVKKLGMLARQIAGKTIDDAIVQMRFSKKKAAKTVLEYLEVARDEAIVKRGMGLGNVASEAEEVKKAAGAPVEIQLKDGKRHTVVDPNKIFIEQAWVGRGPYGKLPEYRAKGKLNIMYTPWTHLAVVLKEEATRIRQYEEREDKRRRQRETKVWTPLPDRPIQGQRQWFSW